MNNDNEKISILLQKKYLDISGNNEISGKNLKKGHQRMDANHRHREEYTAIRMYILLQFEECGRHYAEPLFSHICI